jgi:hypothetical protein
MTRRKTAWASSRPCAVRSRSFAPISRARAPADRLLSNIYLHRTAGRFGGIPLRRQRGAVIADRVPVSGIIRHEELRTVIA